ncbi:taste receptor type 2 member 41-like [Rana temporaria]|uniref:taste receptor type 2 member 41-like n=1 Tax=Rana temporaria TaxID=8407 RepID=UPI001AAC56F7|nr:taste receptor type 2 member 41-like [Rana temporaria]
MSPLGWIWSAFCLLQGLVVIYLNSYIVFILWRSLTEDGKRNPVNLIQMVMGINKITMRCSWIINDVTFWLPEIFDSPCYDISFVFRAFHIYFSYWLTAWLCIYYSIFITNSGHRLFLWIKRNLLAFLNQVLFLTGVGSLAIALLAYMWRYNVFFLRYNSTNGTTIEDISLTDLCKTSAIILGSCLPFIGIAISLVVSLSSLLKHVNNLSQTSFNVQVHVVVIKAMVLFLILSLFFFVCYALTLTKVYKNDNPMYFIIQSLMLIIPTLESIIIIKASPKLRKNFPRWFCFRGTGDG